MHSAKRLVNMSTHARRHQSASARVGMFASRCPFSQLSKNQVLLHLERSDWFCIIPCGRLRRASRLPSDSLRLSSAHFRPASLDLGLAFRWPISRARRQMRGDRIKCLGLHTYRTSGINATDSICRRARMESQSVVKLGQWARVENAPKMSEANRLSGILDYQEFEDIEDGDLPSSSMFTGMKRRLVQELQQSDS